MVGILANRGPSRTALRAASFADLPVFARFFSVAPNTRVGADWDVPVRIGGATAVPGEIVVADESGALFIPAQMPADVLQGRRGRENFERGVVVSKKRRIRDVDPLHPNLEEQLQRQPCLCG